MVRLSAASMPSSSRRWSGEQAAKPPNGNRSQIVKIPGVDGAGVGNDDAGPVAELLQRLAQGFDSDSFPMAGQSGDGSQAVAPESQQG